MASWNLLDWTLLVLCVLGALYEGCLSLRLLWELCFKTSNPIQWDISILSILTLTLYTATSVYFIVYICFKSDQRVALDNDDISEWFYMDIWAIIWNSAQMSCYVLFFKRLRLSFEQKTEHSMSVHQIWFIYTLIIGYGLSNLLLLPQLFEVKWNLSFIVGRIYGLIYAVIIMILNFAIMTTILYVFIKTLSNIAHKLHAQFTASKWDQKYTNTSTVELSSSEHTIQNYGSLSKPLLMPNKKVSLQEIIQIFHLISKLLILYGLMIISTQIAIISISFVEISGITKAKSFTIAVYCYYFTRNIDCIIGSTCIYLSFNQHKSRYMKCCKIPHKCILNYSTNKAVGMSFDTMYHRI